MSMGWTVFPGMNAPGLKGNNAFLKCAFRITKSDYLKNNKICKIWNRAKQNKFGET
jgi:hypothetical protein